MEWVVLGLIFFGVTWAARKLFGEPGEKAAVGCLVLGSIMLIASLPIACYLVLRFLVPLL